MGEVADEEAQSKEVDDRGNGGGEAHAEPGRRQDKSAALGCCPVGCQSAQLDVAFSLWGYG